MERAVQFFVCLSITLHLALVAHAQVPSDFRPPLVVLHADDSDASTFRELVRTTLWYTAQEMSIAANDLPAVTVVRARRSESAQIGISAGPNGALLVLGEPRTKGCLFEMWVVGEDDEYALVTGFVRLLTIQQGLDAQNGETNARRISKRVSSARFALRAAIKRGY